MTIDGAIQILFAPYAVHLHLKYRKRVLTLFDIVKSMSDTIDEDWSKISGFKLQV